MIKQKKLNIGFIAPFLFICQRGIERACIHLANAFAEMQHKVSIISWYEPNGFTASVIDAKIRVIRVPYVRYYRSLWAIPFYVYELTAHSYDVVIIFFAGCGESQALRIARKFRTFQINFDVGYPIELVPHRFNEFYEKKLAQYIDNIVVKSPGMATGISEFFMRDVKVIPYAVDLEVFNPEQVQASLLRSCFNIGAQDYVLLTVAALEERKGVQHVIRVLPLLQRSGYTIHYFVVGDGPYRQILERLAVKYCVNDYVHFIGSVSNVLPYYKLADVFLLLSYGEGLPNALLEAWAMGKPVIVSKHPPYPQIISEDIGVMVKETNHSEIKKCIEKIISSPEKRKQMALSSRRNVEKNYTWQAVAGQYHNLFQKENQWK